MGVESLRTPKGLATEGYAKDSLVILKVTLTILLVVFVIVGLVLVFQRCTDNFDSVYSSLDNRKYHVRSNYSEVEKQKTANYLATIKHRVDKLVKYMLDNQLPNPEISKRLAQRWKRCILKETASHEKKTAAYSVNKGEEIRLCVRTGDNRLENLNTSMFVILHELGHLMSNSYGHGSEFKENFSYIVHLASSIGVYKPQDFGGTPVPYCGSAVTITTTPCQGSNGNLSCEFTNIPTTQPYAPLY